MSLFDIYLKYYVIQNEMFKKILKKNDLNYINSMLHSENKNIIYNFSEIDNLYYMEILIDHKVILKAEYEIIGYYNQNDNIWVWSWANPFMDKILYKDIKEKNNNKLKDIIQSTQNITKEIETVNYFINNPIFYISPENLPDLLNMTLYNTDGFIYININNNINKYILLKNIVQFK